MTLKRVPNLDGMMVDAIEKYAKRIKHHAKHYNYVKLYCKHKIKAMRERLNPDGNINFAIADEQVCDNIYRLHLQGKVDW